MADIPFSNISHIFTQNIYIPYYGVPLMDHLYFNGYLYFKILYFNGASTLMVTLGSSTLMDPLL